MYYSAQCVALILSLLSSTTALPIFTQAPVQSSQAVPPQTSKGKKTEAPPAAKVEPAAALLSPEHQRALGVVAQLHDNSRSYEDLDLKVKVQSRAADAMWDYDEAKARLWFADAFKLVATSTDSAQGDEGDLADRSQLRSEILELISKHDPSWAQRLIKSLVEKPSDSSPRSFLSGLPSYKEADVLKMQVALSIARTDSIRAAAIVRTALKSGIPPLLIDILTAIRSKDRSLADALFDESLVALSRGGEFSDMNMILLGSYVFPTLAQQIEGFQLNSVSSTEQTIDPALAVRFLEAASQLILRRTDNAIHALQKGEEAVSLDMAYLAIQILLPYFDKFQPESAGLIRDRLREIVSKYPDGEAPDDLSETLFSSDLDDLLGRAEKTENKEQKGDLYERATEVALYGGDVDRALSIIEKIPDEGSRATLRALVHSKAAQSALEKGDLEEAYKHTKALTDIGTRAELFARLIAKWIEKKDRVRANELLSEAASLTSKTPEGPDKAAALCVLVRAAQFDSIRCFDVLKSAVDSIGKAGFGSRWKDQINHQVFTPTHRRLKDATVTVGLSRLSLDDSFIRLAPIDFDRTMWLAQSIQPKEASALAQLSVCRGILSKTPVSPKQSQPNKKEPE